MRRETILALIRKEEEQREIRLKAEWTTRHTNSTELNWFNIPFEKIQRAAALKPGEIDGTIRGINNFENVCLTGEFLRVAPKTYHHQVGGSEYSNRDASEVCCSTEPIGEVFCDLGISVAFFEYESHSKKVLRLNGDANDLWKLFTEVTPMEGRNGLREHRVVIETLVGTQMTSLLTRYLSESDLARQAAQGPALKHSRRLKKSRARALSPDAIAKREFEARARAREALSQLLGASCKGILDEWSPTELLGYLRLCQKHEWVLKELMTWSGRTPLGSKALCLEDIEVALDMAKVKSVMDS